MSLPDPNATAPDPATAQLAGATDVIEKKRIELKSMLSTCFAASELQFWENPEKSWSKFSKPVKVSVIFGQHFLKSATFSTIKI